MPIVGLALDAFGFIATLIIFLSCLEERVKRETSSNGFILLTAAIMAALIAHIVAAIGTLVAIEKMVIIGKTVASCLCYVAILFFVFHLKETLYGNVRSAKAICVIAGIICVLSVVMAVLGAHVALTETLSDDSVKGAVRMLVNLQFPLISFFIVTLMILLARDVVTRDRVICLMYGVFPTVGALFDYFVLNLSLTYAGLVISTMVIYANIYIQKRRVIAEQKTALMMSQINPHFMYNTLTTIASLCELEPKAAKSLTIEFSSFLRRNIDTLNTTELIPFEKELSHVECYLKIEKARFKEKINITWSIQSKDFLIPALCVQPIVENAVKHGISKKVDGGTVKISSYATDNAYFVEIKDDGVGYEVGTVPDDDRAHVGLINVRDRLKDMCGGTLTVKSMVGVGTRVLIEIPKKKGKRG